MSEKNRLNRNGAAMLQMKFLNVVTKNVENEYLFRTFFI